MMAQKGTGRGVRSSPRRSAEEDPLESLRRLVEHLQELNRWQTNLLAEASHRLAGIKGCPKGGQPGRQAARSPES